MSLSHRAARILRTIQGICRLKPEADASNLAELIATRLASADIEVLDQ